tara:strand:- start:5574 stop:6290 length:717 start_codon:yes stop_codon:yes gene_type:complete
MTENLSIWEQVCKTDPKNTKPVKLGRTFTAIDPYSQIYEATKVFGSAGKGWGWESVRVEYTPTNEVAILVRLWHGNPEQYIEQWGQAGLYRDRAEQRKDTDCFKKAQTDAITKCLSYLGFNADVFLGKFDDNKYVAEMNHKFAEKKTSDPDWVGPLPQTKLLEAGRAIRRDIYDCEDLDSLVALQNSKETIKVTKQLKVDTPHHWDHEPDPTDDKLNYLGLSQHFKKRAEELENGIRT